jgi:predicted component of type VI protein secretion system
MNTILVKAIKARRYAGFYAYYRGDSRLEWKRICNHHGSPIIYKTRDWALNKAADHARADARSYA